MLDEAWLYAKNVERLRAVEAEEFSKTGDWGRFPDDLTDAVREWIDWNGLRK